MKCVNFAPCQQGRGETYFISAAPANDWPRCFRFKNCFGTSLSSVLPSKTITYFRINSFLSLSLSLSLRATLACLFPISFLPFSLSSFVLFNKKFAYFVQNNVLLFFPLSSSCFLFSTSSCFLCFSSLTQFLSL